MPDRRQLPPISRDLTAPLMRVRQMLRPGLWWPRPALPRLSKSAVRFRSTRSFPSQSSRRRTRSQLTRRGNGCGRGSHKWGLVERVVQLARARQRRYAKCDEHPAGVSDPRKRGGDAGDSRHPRRVRRRYRRSNPGHRTHGSRRTWRQRRRLETSPRSPSWWPDAVSCARTRILAVGRTRECDAAKRSKRCFIERAYAALAMLPRPLLIAFATLGHQIMEVRHLRGIQRRSTAAPAERRITGDETWRQALLVCGVASSLLYALMIWVIR